MKKPASIYIFDQDH